MRGDFSYKEGESQQFESVSSSTEIMIKHNSQTETRIGLGIFLIIK